MCQQCILWKAISHLYGVLVGLPYYSIYYCSRIFSIKRSLQENRKNITLLAMSGAFMFVLSALKLPLVTDSCFHSRGVGVGSVLFGPSAMSILVLLSFYFKPFY